MLVKVVSSRHFVHIPISIRVGQCGNQIGNAFWNTKHKLAKDGILQEIKMIQSVNVNWIYFKEVGALGFISRVSLVDLEPHSLDVIKASPIGTMLSDSVDVFDAAGAGNNWTTGHYTEGVDAIRQEGESLRLLTRFSIYAFDKMQ